MRISKIRVKNLRAFEDEEIILNGYITLVGANGAGKSTILYALNVFFRQFENMTAGANYLEREDFHHLDTTKSIEITLTFVELNPEAQTLFANYYHQNELVISTIAEYNLDIGHASIKQYGLCLKMEDFKDFFDAFKQGEKADILKEKYQRLTEKFPKLPRETAKEKMFNALHSYELENPELCKLSLTEDQFYGFNSGNNPLAQFVQWVYVPAVKDATKEQVEAKNTAFGRLLARTVRVKMSFETELKAIRDEALRRYQELLDQQQGVLEELSQSLNTRLSQWAHPDATLRLTWQQDPKRSVQVDEPVARLMAKEGDFEGELSRFGHGLQRSYLLALLQEAATIDDSTAPTLILGIEEPELYQHPPQARHLAHLLQDLSESNTQVIVTTHSPHFVTGTDFESVRMVRRITQHRKSNIRQVLAKEVSEAVSAATGKPITQVNSELAKLNQILQPQLCEMFFTSRLILVEGLEDYSYITSWLALTNLLKDFRQYGCHVVPVNGKSNLIRPLIVAQKLEIPTFLIFDADGDEKNPEKRAKHQEDNKTLLTLVGGNVNNPFPIDTVWGGNYIVWPDEISKVIASDIGKDPWDNINSQASSKYGSPGGLDKNIMHIATRLDLAQKAGFPLKSLDKLCKCILDFARAN